MYLPYNKNPSRSQRPRHKVIPLGLGTQLEEALLHYKLFAPPKQSLGARSKTRCNFFPETIKVFRQKMKHGGQVKTLMVLLGN